MMPSGQKDSLSSRRVDSLPDNAVGPSHASLNFFSGGGEMGERMRSLDWTTTPLGPPEQWPQSLRSAVSICLNSRFPIALYWGPQLALLYNDSWSSIPGEKHPRALGRPGREVWPEIWTDIGPLFERVQAGGEGVWQQDQLLPMHRHRYTEECYFNFTFSPIRSEDGGIAGVFNAVVETTFRVIGERREKVLREFAERISQARSAEQACALAAEALEMAPTDVPFTLIYLHDDDSGRTSLVQTAGSAIPERLRPLSIVPGDPDAVWPLPARSNQARATALEDLAARSGAPLLDDTWPEPPHTAVIVPIAALHEQQPVGFLVAGVSARRAFDAGYRTFFERIGSLLAAAIGMARAYDAERKRAESLAELDKAKTAFFSNVSHEFRTPLTLMLGPIEEVAANPATSPAVRARLELAQRNGLRLQKLVNSLLEFSRIQAGRVQASYEPTDLCALTRDLASNFRSALDLAGLRFNVECLPADEPVYIDREMFENILLNLLSNAFKFTHKGAITVRLGRDETQAILEVMDTGVGIPLHALPHLFERFYRVEGAAGRTLEGSGIGLALVQELVRLHGGAISAESDLGYGTTFRVRLPLGTAHLPSERIRAPRSLGSTAAGAEAFVQEALGWIPDRAEDTALRLSAPIDRTASAHDQRFEHTKGARILLADDNADMRAYVSSLLAPTYLVEAVQDGQQTLEAARRKRPDLILSDIMMPRLDGFGLLRALRADEHLKDLPVILLSARAGEESRLKGLDAGADDYLVKPFSARELLARVGALLELTRTRREHEERLRLALSSIQDQFYLLDRQWRYTLVNPRVEEITGRPATQLLGRSVFELFPDLIGTSFESELAAVLRTGEPRRFEFEYRPFNRCFENAVYPAADGVALLVADVTVRKQTERALREREEQLRLATEAADVGLWDVDLITDTLFWPPRVKAMFGISAHVPVSMADFYAGLHSDDRGRTSHAFAAALDSDRRALYDVEYRTVGKEDGLIRWVAAKGRGIFDASGRCVRVIGTAIDITSRKRAEEQLRESDRQKDEFLAMLAHELRNPLAPISTAGELLSRIITKDSRARSAIEMIKRQTMQLTRLVDDLLDVSRITQGRIQLHCHPIDLASVIAQAVEAVEPQLRAKQHRLSTLLADYEPLYVDGDHARLMQCVVNVLTNAAKYTDSGGEIRIQSRADREQAVIEIADTGSGISPELLPKVFDLFVQSDRTLDRSQGGLGIGLAVVKRLIEMHGGEVSASSPGIGRGSSFEIRLPRITRPQLSIVGTTQAKAPPRRVFIVDDNQDAANSLSELLNLHGHETQVAFSGQQALADIESFHPDVALLDLGLPAMDGYALAQRLRALPQLNSLRLVALTGYGQAEDRQRTQEAGFDDHLVKPVDLMALERSLTGIAVERTRD